MDMKKQLFLLVLLPVMLQALPFQSTVVLEKANELFLKKDYPGAAKLYAQFLEEVKPETLKEDLDKKIYQGAKNTQSDLNFLLKMKPLDPLFRKALNYEVEGALKKSQAEYLAIYQRLEKEKIQDVIYFDQIIKGNLEEALLENKREELGKYSYAFLKKLQDDKARKKTVVFFEFQKDRRITTDVETLVKNSLINTIQRMGTFTISRKVYQGPVSKRFEALRADAVDFVIMGRYSQGANETIVLNFSILDPFRGQTLVDVQVTAAFDMNFFGTIDRIARDLERNLRNYSRFEDFSTIKYVQRNQGGLTRTVTDQAAAKNLQQFVREKIMALEIAYLEKLDNDIQNKPNVAAYAAFAQEILSFNTLSYPAKLPFTERMKNKRQPLKSLALDHPDFREIREEMKKSLPTKDYGNFYDLFEDGLEHLEDQKKEYAGLAFLWDEIRAEMEKEKAEVDVLVSQLGMRREYRFGLRLAAENYMNFPGDSGNFGETDQFFLKDDRSFLVGLVYDQRIFGNFWLTTGLGVGRRQSVLQDKFNLIGGDQELATGFIYSQLGFKYFILDNLSINNFLQFEGYLSDDEKSNQYAEYESGGPMWFIGAEYYFNLTGSFDLSLGLHAGIPFDNMELKPGSVISFLLPPQSDNRMSKDILVLQFQLTGYYGLDTVNIPEGPSPNQGWWLGILAGSTLGLRLDDVGTDGKEAHFSSFTPGLAIGYYFNRALSLNLDTYFVSSTLDEDQVRGQIKGIVQTLTIDLEVLRFWRLGLFLQTGIQYGFFYERDLSYFDSVMFQYKDATDDINSANFSLIPIGLGLSIQLSEHIRFKEYFQFGLDLTGMQYELIGGLKLEFKI